MKKLLYLLLLTPIIYLASCSPGKGEFTPETMEETIVGKEWWNITDEEGMLLTEEGDFYYLQVCHQDSLMGSWIIDGDLIKLRFYINSIEYTALIGEVTSYTDTELKIKVETDDPHLQGNYVFTTEFAEILGCTDATADNYNEDANCDDGSCSYCSNNCTYVPDDNFEQALINLGYDNVLDDYVLTANINNVTSLYLPGDLMDEAFKISDLTGIEGFTALTNLDVSHGHSLTSLDLSQNTALTTLSCIIAGLASIDVSQNTALTYLDLTGNYLTSLDLSANTSLQVLLCVGGTLTSLDLSNNPNLTYLYCANNNLTSLDLRNGNNTNLQHLDVVDNPNLDCIDVDDAAWSTVHWNPSWDPSMLNFSEDCGAKK